MASSARVQRIRRRRAVLVALLCLVPLAVVDQANAALRPKTKTVTFRWPAARVEEEFSFTVRVARDRPLDYYGSSIQIGSRVLKPGNLRYKVQCPDPKSWIDIDFYSLSESEVIVKLVVRGGNCRTARKMQTATLKVVYDELG